ncbi:glycoside hydrolase family 127 protein [uncultured Sunxiuqinia sp.]|uniref:glycoside hydrolase family 127 protein n=1 Tax=uncultured Sunxiuqinia sp. TaxID=1573825 RepID=UPI002AA6897F|nr:glycoside hydrolase family 127 protein [uncultured Sunxiuqinia sp.]
MKKLIALYLVFGAVSCSIRSTTDPIDKSERLLPDQISLGGVLAELLVTDSVDQFLQADSSYFISEIESMSKRLEQLKAERKELDGTNLSKQWDGLNQEVLLNFETLSIKDVNAWVALSDSLLKYTQEVRFADALERIAYNPVGNNQISKAQLKSFYYTRLYDRIYFNVLGSSSLHYEHTTGGVVRLVQATDYPFDNRISIKVELQDTRYLDFYIRIPEWATNSTIMVKGVKYAVIPGRYTEIAKKWKNGDEVEIMIGIEPEVVENNDSAFALTYGSLFLTYLNSSIKQLAFHKENPIDYLKMVSPAGKLTTFTFTGVEDTTLVFQPYFSKEYDSIGRTAWINRR